MAGEEGVKEEEATEEEVSSPNILLQTQGTSPQDTLIYHHLEPANVTGSLENRVSCV